MLFQLTAPKQEHVRCVDQAELGLHEEVTAKCSFFVLIEVNPYLTYHDVNRFLIMLTECPAKSMHHLLAAQSPSATATVLRTVPKGKPLVAIFEVWYGFAKLGPCTGGARHRRPL